MGIRSIFGSFASVFTRNPLPGAILAGIITKITQVAVSSFFRASPQFISLIARASSIPGGSALINYGPSVLIALATGVWIAKVEEEQKKKSEKVDGKGYTPLHYAVIDAPLEEIQLLVKQGANIHAKVEEKDETPARTCGNTPLHFAVRYGRMDVVLHLLGQGCKILEENTKGENTIHIAGDTGWKEIFDLLKKNANIEEEDSPLFYTVFDLAEYDQLEALKLHVRKGLDINTSDEDGFTLLHYAARRGKLETVKFLVSEGAKKEAKNTFNQTPYMLAYSNGWNEVMEFLKLQGVSSELGGTTFIWEDFATSISAVTNCKLYGANPLGRDAQGRTALHYLSSPGEIKEILRLHISLVNAADQNGDTPLHLVKSIPSLDILCEHGAFIDAENKWGQTPLNCALQEGNLKVAEDLLGRKAKLNASATNKDGEPFLHCFIRKQKEDAGIELLKKLFAEYAVEIDCRNSKGETCLHLVAAQWNSSKMILFLLEQKADLINLKDHLGQTALHRAFRMDKQRDLLIQKGADLSMTDNEGRTPHNLYRQKEKEEKGRRK